MVIMELVKLMIRNIFNYLRWSNIEIGFSFNPVRWFRFSWEDDSGWGPNEIYKQLCLGPLRLTIYIDDGSY